MRPGTTYRAPAGPPEPGRPAAPNESLPRHAPPLDARAGVLLASRTTERGLPYKSPPYAPQRESVVRCDSREVNVVKVVVEDTALKKKFSRSDKFASLHSSQGTC